MSRFWEKTVARLTLWLLVWLLGTTALAKSHEMPRRTVGVSHCGNQLAITVGFKDVFTPTVRKKLTSGLPTRLVVQVITQNDEGEQIAFFARTIQITYDLWTEDFAVTIKERGHFQSFRASDVNELISRVGALRRAVVARNLPDGKVQMKVRIEANPVSEKMIHNIQRWISKPKGRFNSGSGSSNYFGSFVGYFVNRDIGKADKTILFRSQWITP